MILVNKDIKGLYLSSYSIKTSYINNELKEAIKKGDWDVLESMPILFDLKGEPIIYFGEDEWDITYLSESNCNILFYKVASKGKKQILERNIKNQIKCLALSLIYFYKHRYKPNSISQTVRHARKIAHELLNLGFNDFNEITNITLKKISSVENANFKTIASTLKTIKRLNHTLPFSIKINKSLSKNGIAKLANTSPKLDNQRPVIPFRIYSEIINSLGSDIKALHNKLSYLKKLSNKIISARESAENEVKHAIRVGKYSLSTAIRDDSQEKLINMFKDSGIDIHDNYSSKEWDKVWNDCKPVIHSSIVDMDKHFNKFSIFEKINMNFGEAREFIIKNELKCCILIIQLTGSRFDELYNASPEFGLQTIRVDGYDIHLFTTRQSKITPGTQSVKDTFVINDLGKKAFEVLKAMKKPFCDKFGHPRTGALFYNIRHIWNLKISAKSSMESAATIFLNNPEDSGINSIIDQNDLNDLISSEANISDYAIGEAFRILLHSFRRSFAYYLIGYELLSYPQLKQQLSHYSLAMTKWYARFAYKLAKRKANINDVYQEVCNERVRQQANTLARLHSKISNSERLAGGKGRSLYQHGFDQRKLSVKYWKNEIENRTAHIHAIGPGMWCVNDNCGMRMNIDLSECVNCETSVIEEASYSESARMQAMIELALLLEKNELTHSLLSRFIVHIRSAEAILSDLKVPFQRYKLPYEAEIIAHSKA